MSTAAASAGDGRGGRGGRENGGGPHKNMDKELA